jgi:hypothetical protein
MWRFSGGHSLPRRRLLAALYFCVLSLSGGRAWAAACCGGGFAAPSLIVGDDRAQLTASYGYSQIVDDIGSDSLWRRRDARESSETFKFEGAHIFRDRWQAGFSLPLVRRTRAAESSSGLGDVTGTLGYEYLPDWDYNPWRPRGLGFLQLTVPSGRSIQESESDYQLDARGRGFWAAGVGTMLTKILGRWDMLANFDVHRSFAKHYRQGDQSEGELHPGYGGNLGLGGGYNWADWRAGGVVTWTYEDPIDVTGTVDSRGSAQRYATATLSASYMMRDDWATTVSYSDQTWFGTPTNTTLGRGVMLVLQRRWSR